MTPDLLITVFLKVCVLIGCMACMYCKVVGVTPISNFRVLGIATTHTPSCSHTASELL
jgi:hypothetical protein